MQGYAQVIGQIEAKVLDEETKAGLETMLGLETFSNLHPLIKQKLQEFEEHKKKAKETVVGAFKIKAGGFYMTANNSIVMCVGGTTDGGKDEVVRMVVVEGGYSDKDIPNGMALSLFGDMRLYGCYAADKMGRCCAALDESDYPMHITKSIVANFSVDN